uniref:Uncharacterized protein n=1 Tax=Rangifer tarandus platyrhynchus TaxID=3082113 RepID=A0ACB0EH73_RANTA|nr:unnamed protein product [Rangifer tarandus platyrhynchus]
MHLKPPWAPSVTEIAACEVTGTLMHSRQCRKDATPLAAPKNEATLPERWQEAGLEEIEDHVLTLSIFVNCVAMQWSGAEFPDFSSVAVDPSPLLRYCPVMSMFSSSWA